MKQFKILLFIMINLFYVAIAWSALSMSIQVKNTELRDYPSFLGNVVASLVYRERVEIIKQQGAWMEVNSLSGNRGWLHQSTLTTKLIVFSHETIDANPVASEEELSLAGKGFNAHVEEKFRSDHSDIDFTWVDKMEQIEIPTQEIVSFLKEGGLELNGGGK